MSAPEDRPRDLLDEVVRMALFAADDAVINGRFRTHAEETRAAVRAAFELAVGNRLIRLTPFSEWPSGVVLTPPYDQPVTGEARP